ncbi:threonylcarbamoyl-AMP synthase [Candidatus Woesearchaeota archaeon]|jgi:L-threonylcarbamoyladenylate synthase|nr:threonylcarbamoyl-AMP synthase [Candidatus Woesearchaeota archaeon]MBT3537163.1 threonylcarbamoyl-AMP synthase [Candidatus Woesearchaeota archaeon]MBT4696691.1 threonylcarbamoyl-AMP synthase [Candidatus Woesearchaeota archaeon]MBT4717509.1 threonylcarbamoyl-AMP synthase [Candidatus Woesearchaeota archaeon]MBT7106527.1 threonylcarbamoyl-AMP synthase [Candidatus Woesearchaeota archaeon]
MIVSRGEFFGEKDKYLSLIKDGAVFIILTDTIYGLSCDATNPAAVLKLRQLKGMGFDKPMSVIAPSKEWIKENCLVSSLDKLPGPYTFILPLHNKSCVSFEVNNGSDALGVRIPDHWCSKLCSEYGIPLITTSANVTGKPNMTSVDDLDPSIKSKVDFIIDEGVKEGKASTIIDYRGGAEKVLRE